MIILDDKPIKNFGFDVQSEYEDPITPEFERKTIAIPGLPRLWDFGTEIKGKSFSYPLKIMNRFHDEMQSAFNELVAFLFDEFGKPRLIKIVREYEPDKFIMAKVAEQMIPQRLTGEGELILPFVAMDPYKYSNTYADEVTWGSETITFEYNYLLGREGVNGSVKVTSPQTISVPVDGLAMQPIFEINGTANNLEISAKGYSFKLPDISNTKWSIDFEKYLVYKDGKETMEEIREFYLMPGNNQVKITGSNINLDMRIKFRDKFM